MILKGQFMQCQKVKKRVYPFWSFNMFCLPLYRRWIEESIWRTETAQSQVFVAQTARKYLAEPPLWLQMSSLVQNTAVSLFLGPGFYERLRYIFAHLWLWSERKKIRVVAFGFEMQVQQAIDFFYRQPVTDPESVRLQYFWTTYIQNQTVLPGSSRE